jgi:hypothetical protein
VKSTIQNSASDICYVIFVLKGPRRIDIAIPSPLQPFWRKSTGPAGIECFDQFTAAFQTLKELAPPSYTCSHHQIHPRTVRSVANTSPPRFPWSHTSAELFRLKSSHETTSGKPEMFIVCTLNAAHNLVYWLLFAGLLIVRLNEGCRQ